ncbi:MAG: 3-deoxy-manno-octulosonate cytidylyltransferase [Deltaproteobacteria bacterium]|nr:3-deoxy-manno-octulosonate cytidylyltransferase [Deltaproteobacteria bacterium]
MQTIVVIPARLDSTRLPEKPLLDLGGRPLIQHVHARATAASRPSRVVVATDSPRILEAVEAFGGEALLTSSDCASGTDRVAEAVRQLEARGERFDAVVNLQGDEPFIEPGAIDAACAALAPEAGGGKAPIATLARALRPGELADPSVVKVVTDAAGLALYFSRAPLGQDRERPGESLARAHLGLYAYLREALIDFSGLAPTPLEQAERLEQLRALEHGRRIAVADTEWMPAGIDTPEDLERARAALARKE